ncbi:cytochrome D1 domain-containing protein, partial [Streptomyces sp. NPDC004675]|uniref:YncE family protein n=1 Tax=Streptomyces sp. NPDC004675 TaxID=3154286 RepID=UPI0033B01F8A
MHLTDPAGKPARRGPGPNRSGPWAWLRACVAGLAVLAGLALPAISSSPAWADPSPDAYVANGGSGNVSVIDTRTNTVVATVPVGSGPQGVASTPNGRRVYVANRGSNTVSVIDTRTNTVVATIPVGTMPLGIAITPNGRRVYVANVLSGVSVIDTRTNTVVATVPVGGTLAGVAITP